MVGIVDGTVVTLDIGHQVVVQVLAEHVAAEARSRCSEHTRLGCGQQFIRIAVGQHHDHLLGLALCEQVVEDIVDAAYLIIHLFGIGSSADAVEHRVFLVRVLIVLRWQIDHGLVGGTKTLGVVVDIVYLSVGHVLDVVCQTAFLGRNLQEAVLEALIGEILRILRIHHAHTVDDEAIGVHVGGSRTEGYRPVSLIITLHRMATCELHVYQHFLGFVVRIPEGHRAVSVDTCLRYAK